MLEHRDVPRWAPAVALAAVAAVYVVVTWNSTAPVFTNDEVGNLAAAKLFAEPHTGWLLTGASYMPGFSVLLTPAWWISSDPLVVYRIAIIVGALLSLATVVPLAALARRFGAAPRVSWVLAAIVMAAPARALNANYVWAEMLLFLAVAWTAELAFRLPDARFKTALIFGLVVGSTFAAHGRALPFTLLALVGGAWLVRHSLPNVAAVLSGGAVAAGTGYALYQYVNASMYFTTDRVSRTLSSLDDATVRGYVDALASQTWYQVAAWAGLTIIGFGVVVREARSERLRGPHAMLAMLAIVMTLLVPLLTANSIEMLQRIELHFYGRYLDPFVSVLAVVGLARLTRPVRLRWALALSALAVASGAAFLWLVAPGIAPATSLTPIHSPGVAYLLHPAYAATGQTENWVTVALIAIVPAVVVAVAAARQIVALTVVSVWFASVTLWTDLDMFDYFESFVRTAPAVVTAVEPIDHDVDLYADYKYSYTFFHGNEFTFWLTPRRYIYMDSTKDTSDVQMFLGSETSEFARAEGARPIDAPLPDDAVIWVLPGPLQDELEAQGRLGPVPSDAS